jgi:hypothetical protein
MGVMSDHERSPTTYPHLMLLRIVRVLDLAGPEAKDVTRVLKEEQADPRQISEPINFASSSSTVAGDSKSHINCTTLSVYRLPNPLRFPARRTLHILHGPLLCRMNLAFLLCLISCIRLCNSGCSFPTRSSVPGSPDRH